MRALRFESERLGEEPPFARLLPSATRWCYIDDLCRILKLDPFTVIGVAEHYWSKKTNAPYFDVVGIRGHWCIRAAPEPLPLWKAARQGASTEADGADKYNIINEVEDVIDDDEGGDWDNGDENEVKIEKEVGDAEGRDVKVETHPSSQAPPQAPTIPTRNFGAKTRKPTTPDSPHDWTPDIDDPECPRERPMKAKKTAHLDVDPSGRPRNANLKASNHIPEALGKPSRSYGPRVLWGRAMGMP